MARRWYLLQAGVGPISLLEIKGDPTPIGVFAAKYAGPLEDIVARYNAARHTRRIAARPTKRKKPRRPGKGGLGRPRK